MSSSSHKALAVAGPSQPFKLVDLQRREQGLDDLTIEIIYCGICHTDVHVAQDDDATFPIVPGHEIVGRVKSAGSNVSNFKVGDLVGVGTMVGSCANCASCNSGMEQHCSNGTKWTYGVPDSSDPSGVTQGGYSDAIVVDKNFVLKIPQSLNPAKAAPLLCAGITMYSPLRMYGVTAGTRVGIAGFGGLGDVGVKFAKAMGAEVTVLTSSPAKAEAARKAGADKVIDVNDKGAMKDVGNSLDLIISTIPKSHDMNPYLNLLRIHGKYVIVGALGAMEQPFESRALRNRRAAISSSLVGGIKETQEMLDFAAAHGIVSTAEIIGVAQVDNAFRSLSTGEADHRYVIDMSTLGKQMHITAPSGSLAMNNASLVAPAT